MKTLSQTTLAFAAVALLGLSGCCATESRVIIPDKTVAELTATPANKGAPEHKSGMHGVKKVEGRLLDTPAPVGADVLFDGKPETVAANWVPERKGAKPWPVKDGIWIDANNTDMLTKKPYGSVFLHLEWRIPASRKNISGQRGANSGIIFMPKGWYEVQILESHNNPGNTYSDGMAGAIYQRSTPSANPARPQGEWQSYDITFIAPKFGEKGEVLRKPRFNVVFNGVTVQDNVEIEGSTLSRKAKLSKHPEKQPFKLQFHGDPIEFRNIWVKEIKE
jgi:hypothetical protein